MMTIKSSRKRRAVSLGSEEEMRNAYTTSFGKPSKEETTWIKYKIEG
jgi:hypothetical protein